MAIEIRCPICRRFVAELELPGGAKGHAYCRSCGAKFPVNIDRTIAEIRR